MKKKGFIWRADCEQINKLIEPLKKLEWLGLGTR